MPVIAFAGNPIEVRATSDLSSSARMPRVVCVVTEKVDKIVDGVSQKVDGRSYTMCYSISSNDKHARFDISDTLYHLIELDESYSVSGKAVSKTSSSIKQYVVKLYDEQFFNGRMEHSEHEEIESGVYFVIAGRFGDLRRLDRSGANLSAMRLSRKPIGRKEHGCYGFLHHYSELVYDEGWNVVHHTEAISNDVDNVCALPFNGKMHHPIVFRNSYGELESCMAICREEESVGGDSSVFYSNADISYHGQRVGLHIHGDTDTTLKLTTGGVSHQWARWWSEEPLCAMRAWIWVTTDDAGFEGRFVPCVLRRDGGTVLNRSAGISSISFTAVLDWQNGLL